MAFKLSGVGLTPRAGEPARPPLPKPYLPPSGGSTGLLAQPARRPPLSTAENMKPAPGDDHRTLERKYIDNLQQQVYYLELELKQLKAKCPGGQALDATVKAGESRSVTELQEQLASLEKRAERLREDGLRAMMSEKRASEDKAIVVEQLRRQAEDAASQREELTVEAVNLQTELERAYLKEKTLRAELADANALAASRESQSHECDSKVRLLTSIIEEKDRELSQTRSQMERLRKDLAEAEANIGALREKYDAKRQSEASLQEQRRELAEEAKQALTDLRQTQIILEREQAARKQAEQNESYLVKENAGLETLVKDVTATADRLSLENERMRTTMDNNKMVSVVGRFMVRKFHGKLRGLEEAKKVIEEAQASLHMKLVRAQQKTDAIDAEFAKERRRADILAKHYSKQEEDAAKLTVENRRLLDKLQDMSRSLESSTGQLETLKSKLAEVEAHAKRLDEEAALATLLKGLRLGDLQTDASKFGEVASAIKSLIPRLEARQ